MTTTSRIFSLTGCTVVSVFLFSQLNSPLVPHALGDGPEEGVPATASGTTTPSSTPPKTAEVDSAALTACKAPWTVMPAPFNVAAPELQYLNPDIIFRTEDEGASCRIDMWNRNAIRTKDQFANGSDISFLWKKIGGNLQNQDNIAVVLRTDGKQATKRSWEVTNGIVIRFQPEQLAIEQKSVDADGKVTSQAIKNIEIATTNDTWYSIRIVDSPALNIIAVYFTAVDNYVPNQDPIAVVQPFASPDEPKGHYVLFYNREPVGNVFQLSLIKNPLVVALPMPTSSSSSTSSASTTSTDSSIGNFSSSLGLSSSSDSENFSSSSSIDPLLPTNSSSSFNSLPSENSSSSSTFSIVSDPMGSWGSSSVFSLSMSSVSSLTDIGASSSASVILPPCISSTASSQTSSEILTHSFSSSDSPDPCNPIFSSIGSSAGQSSSEE